MHASLRALGRTSVVLLASACSAQVAISPLFATGGAAPGFPAGATVSDFNWQRQLIGPAGDFAIRGLATGGGVTPADDEAVWHVSPSGAAALLIREGDPAPGLAGVFIGGIGTVLRPGSDGSALVLASLTGAVTDGDDSALWRCAAGQAPQLVTREGDPAPGLSGVLLPPIRTMAPFNDREAVLSYNSQYLYVTTPTGLAAVALAGAAAPDAGGASFAGIGVISCADGGARLGFVATLSGADPASDSGIWMYTASGGTHLLAREGGAAPDIADATLGELANAAPIVGGGGAAILVPLAGAGVTAADDSAAYRIGGGGLSLVFREGDDAPTVPALPIGAPILVAPGGPTVFSTATLVGADPPFNQVILSYAGTTGSTVAREGDGAPDLPGLTLASFNAFDIGNPVRANNAARFILPAMLAGPGVDASNARVVLASDLLGGLRLLLRNGDTLPLPGGADATVTGLLSGDINDDGTIALVTSFSGGLCLYSATVGCPHAGCTGFDLDGNCQVGISDLALFLSAFGSTGPAGDTDGDGDVDIQDLANFLSAFGTTCD